MRHLARQASATRADSWHGPRKEGWPQPSEMDFCTSSTSSPPRKAAGESPGMSAREDALRLRAVLASFACDTTLYGQNAKVTAKEVKVKLEFMIKGAIVGKVAGRAHRSSLAEAT